MPTSAVERDEGADVVLEGPGVVVRPAGDLDMNTAPEVFDAVLAVMGSVRETGGLILDLADVEFIDASGLNAFVRVRQLCCDSGTPLVLRNVGR